MQIIVGSCALMSLEIEIPMNLNYLLVYHK